MTLDAPANLVSLLFDQANKNGKKPFLYAKHDGRYQPQSWTDVADKVARLAAALMAQGIGRGDRVMLVSENRPEWLIADFAIMAAGAISVPAYTTSTTADYQHILNNSGARGVIISSPKLARMVLPAVHQSDHAEFVIAIDDTKLAQSINARILRLEDILAQQSACVERMQAAARQIRPDDIACLIYTSGTGGAPKGVMISHKAILHNCMGACDVLAEIGLSGNRFLSFLPLSHAYEHSAGQALPVAIGAEIFYAEGLDKLAANMAEARPTIMVVVPRLFEMLRQRVLRQVEKEGGLKEKLFHQALALGVKRHEQGGRLDLLDEIMDRLLDRLVRAKVRRRFGGRLKALVSGGAPLNRQVGSFFIGLGLPLLQGYGQTEAAPIISVNRPHQSKVNSVGPPMKGVEVKIAEDGEILVRGDLLMAGYWGDERATHLALREGWLHTGDIGQFDADGHLFITDRKKDIIVSDKGENISPQRVEGMLSLEPEIAQVMIFGDEKPYLVGLIVPDAEWMAAWAKAAGHAPDLKALADNKDLHAALDKAVSRVNKRLASPEKLRRFALADEAFSIENEQMTPTLKIRRHVISKVYRNRIEGLYAGHGKHHQPDGDKTSE
ncbi:long-chain fatty acid--CoA ligase [Iodidimonas sp. MBR-14]|uniref:AMP-dependent synthetase/ligase n=1 Tax=Iodidimonas sp. MBR-14 TaxID=3032319 RepID=UPI0024830D8F|nr:long-chain fatty acid--CoA ligase [Iodidimonas sp. MBR-14]